MRKIILQMMVSVDGYVSGPNGELDWIDNDPEMGEAHSALAKNADAALMGYHVYQGMSGFWPEAEKNPNPGAPANEAEFAKIMNSMKKIVITKSDEELTWNNTSACVASSEEEIVAKVKALKEEEGNYLLLYGGAKTAQTLIKNGLVDELRIDVCPVALGSGTPLFIERTALALVSVKSWKSGAMTVIYTKK